MTIFGTSQNKNPLASKAKFRRTGNVNEANKWAKVRNERQRVAASHMGEVVFCGVFSRCVVQHVHNLRRALESNILHISRRGLGQ
jgi:hypothetical protein